MHKNINFHDGRHFFKMAAMYKAIYIVTPIFDLTRTINSPKLTRILFSVNFIFLNHKNYKKNQIGGNLSNGRHLYLKL